MKKVKLSDIGSLVKTTEQVEQFANHYFKEKSWMRIGETDRSNWGAAIVSLHGIGTSLTGRALVFAFSSGDVMASKLHSSSSNNVSKCRIIRDNTKSYIEVYHDYSSDYLFRVVASNIIEFNLYQEAVDGHIPEGATHTEFNL